MEKPEILTENQMVRIIPFGKFETLWAAGSEDTCFPLVFIFPADVGCIFTFSFFHKVKLSHLKFMHKIFQPDGSCK